VSIGEADLGIEIRKSMEGQNPGRGTSKSRGTGCWRCGEMGHIQKDCKLKKDGEDKDKEKDFVYIT